MTTKYNKVAAALNSLGDGALDPQYVGFFECFNQQQFFEAHEVLEPLWLAQRREPDGAFYKGLIQLAGAFVHLQKGRQQPAKALLQLAQTNLQAFPALHHELDLEAVLELIHEWSGKLEANESCGMRLVSETTPRLHLRQR